MYTVKAKIYSAMVVLIRVQSICACRSRKYIASGGPTSTTKPQTMLSLAQGVASLRKRLQNRVEYDSSASTMHTSDRCHACHSYAEQMSTRQCSHRHQPSYQLPQLWRFPPAAVSCTVLPVPQGSKRHPQDLSFLPTTPTSSCQPQTRRCLCYRAPALRQSAPVLSTSELQCQFCPRMS